MEDLLPVVTLNGVPLVIKKNAKCLGVKIDKKLSWRDHISSAKKKLAKFESIDIMYKIQLACLSK